MKCQLFYSQKNFQIFFSKIEAKLIFFASIQVNQLFGGKNMENKIFIPKDKKLLDPKVDSTFKSLFTHEGAGSKIALKSLVTAIIGYEPETVEVVNNELSKELIYAKDIRLDLQCKMADGSKINVEMQTCLSNDNLKNRALYYGCRMMGGLDMQGKPYSMLPRVYHVMFTNFGLFNQNEEYMRKFILQSDGTVLSDCLQIIFIQMPFLEISGKDINNLLDIEKWIIFLRDSTDKKKRDLLNRIMGSNEGIKEAGEILMTISDDEREWAIQEMRYKAEVDREAFRIAAHDKGLEEGVEIGEQQGLETAARGMKAENIPVETIVKITGLTAEQVEAL